MIGSHVPIKFFTWDTVAVTVVPVVVLGLSRERVVHVFTGDISLALPLSLLLPAIFTTSTLSLPLFMSKPISARVFGEFPNAANVMFIPRSLSSFRLELTENSDSAEDTTSPGSSSTSSTGRRRVRKEVPTPVRDGPLSNGASTARGGCDPSLYD